MKAEWYFDFVSPFSYLQLQRLAELPADIEIVYRPVLFAGLLGHWGHKGPAEIPAKRRQTYRMCQWLADRRGVPFKMPPRHPFNPLAALRLCIALDCTPEVVGTIFAFVFAEGREFESVDGWRALCDRLGVEDGTALASHPDVKAALRANTEGAAAEGIYGVPTLKVAGEIFWGDDTTDMLLDFLADRRLFDSEEMARISAMPMGVERR